MCVWCAIECIPDLLLVVLFPLLPGLGGCGGGAVLQCTSGDSCTTVELGKVSMPCTCPSERKPSNFYKLINFMVIIYGIGSNSNISILLATFFQALCRFKGLQTVMTSIVSCFDTLP